VIEPILSVLVILMSLKLTIGDTGELSGEFRVGRTYNLATVYAEGEIDDVRTYNRALTAAEIKQLYDSIKGDVVNKTITPAGSLQTGLTGYWTFNGPDVSGTTVLDKSGNGYNAVNYSTSGSTPVPIVPVIGKLGQGIDFTDLYYLNTTNASNLITASEGAISV